MIMEHPQFFEDYRIGDGRRTFGRTITETDIVVHAGHSGDFSRIIWTPSFAAPNPLGRQSRSSR